MSLNVYRRYFRISQGPVIEELKRVKIINDAAHLEYLKLLEEHDCQDQYYSQNRKLVAVVFKEGKFPGDKLWKRAPRCGSNAWYPKKNSAAAKAIWDKFEKVQTIHPTLVLKSVGVDTGFPRLLANGKSYFAAMVVINSKEPVLFVSIPWFDADPEKLKDPDTQDWNYTALKWKPSAEMVEVKHWEYLREVEDWNSLLKIN